MKGVARNFEDLLPADRIEVLSGKARPGEPAIVLRPPDKAAVVAIVRRAAEEGVVLWPAGGGTSLRRGPRRSADPRPVARLDLAGLDRVVDHAAGDLVLTAEAGVPVARAEAHVAEKGQRLPFEAPRAGTATLGGLLAAGTEGPTVHADGRLRDAVLGIEVVHGDGRVSRAGGRVVKNVSGYDHCRLHVGARGILGIILEVSLRLRGREEATALHGFGFRDAESALAAGRAVREAVPEVFSLHVLEGEVVRSLDGRSSAALAVRLRGSRGAVAAMADEVRNALPAAEGLMLPENWPALLAEPVPADWAWLEVAVLPSRLPALLEVLGSLRATDRRNPRRVVLDPDAGLLHLGLGSGWPYDEAWEAALGERLAALEARLQLWSDPRFHLRRERNFPSCRMREAPLVRRIRKTLDPAGILNPGHFESDA